MVFEDDSLVCGLDGVRSGGEETRGFEIRSLFFGHPSVRVRVLLFGEGCVLGRQRCSGTLEGFGRWRTGSGVWMMGTVVGPPGGPVAIVFTVLSGAGVVDVRA